VRECVVSAFRHAALLVSSAASGAANADLELFTTEDTEGHRGKARKD
jgi:hypothetical protein